MNNITLNGHNFEELLQKLITYTQESSLEYISYILEKIDDTLAANRNIDNLIIIKKVPRTILTSIGKITFTRRYYLDIKSNKHLYLLDYKFKIPKYSRISSELKKKILLSLDHLSFEQAGKDNLPTGHSISSTTVFNILRKTELSFVSPKLNVSNKTIHVQIDEKYLHMRNRQKHSESKRLYTATIFDDIKKIKNRNTLYNRMILSSRNLVDLFSKINTCLKQSYSVNFDTHIYISGDLATYIQNAPYSITCCKATYVPDKFHVKRSFKSILGIHLSKNDIFSPKFSQDYLSYLNNSSINQKDAEVIKLKHLLKYNSESLKNWYNFDYLGCSQECMNSHYFASRFDKKPNCFSTKSIDKISIIINAKHNNLPLQINLKEKYYSNPSIHLSPDWFYKENRRYIDFNNFSNHILRNTLRSLSGL